MTEPNMTEVEQLLKVWLPFYYYALAENEADNNIEESLGYITDVKSLSPDVKEKHYLLLKDVEHAHKQRKEYLATLERIALKVSDTALTNIEIEKMAFTKKTGATLSPVKQFINKFLP